MFNWLLPQGARDEGEAALQGAAINSSGNMRM
jgi:hypothetical protein